MSFTTQDLVDWALAQDVRTHPKLVLFVLAFRANPEGGGRITMAQLCADASERPARVAAHLMALAEMGLLMFRLVDGDQIEYGLSVRPVS